MAGWLLLLMPVQVVVSATVADIHTLRMCRKRSGTRSRFFFCNNVGWQQNKRENGLCKQPGSLDVLMAAMLTLLITGYGPKI